MSDTYSFELPQHHKSIIKVIGVGGGGSNAVNHMFNLGIKDVEFVSCNTDAQALKSSPVPHKLQIGINITEGLGAGANPDVGREAAVESKDDIRELLGDSTKMLFITAGMGGGTGTGAAPVIAKIAKEMDILTVGIVTVPFAFEGKKKQQLAQKGVDELRESCDTVLVILNDKLREIYGNLPISDAFSKADNVLTTAAKGIAEIITVPGYVNVDFQDVRTVMMGAGAAVMGSATMEGEGRARRAAEAALVSPLLNNREVHGAQKILLSIISGEQAELQMDELTDITEYIQEMAGDEAEVIFGHGVDPDLGENIRVTLIATGFDADDVYAKPKSNSEPEKKVIDLNDPMPDEPVRLADEFESSLEPVLKDIERESESEPSPMEEDYERSFEDGYEFMVPPKREEPASVEDELLPDYGLLAPEVKSKKERLEMKRKERIEKLSSSERRGLQPEDVKNKLDEPAYTRKKVRFDDVPHSSERNFSRLSLNDDNQILGNNKYLHDNVD
ncbi:MAG: cell division protein FtsZ [Bacteroidota bacterium]